MIKLKRMELTLQELNEIYYCLNKVSDSITPTLINYKLVNEIRDKIGDEIGRLAMDEVNSEINELKLTGKL
jgi:hypothetical protein